MTRARPKRARAAGASRRRSASPPAGRTKARESRKIVYRQGGRWTAVERLDTLAIRWTDGRHGAVRRALASLGRIKDLRSQRILVLDPADAASLASARGKLSELQARGAVEFVTPVLRDPGSDTQQILTGEITVRFRGGQPKSTVGSVLKRHGLRLLRRNEFRPDQYLVAVPDPSGLRTLQAADELDASDEVEFAAPNFISEIKR